MTRKYDTFFGMSPGGVLHRFHGPPGVHAKVHGWHPTAVRDALRTGRVHKGWRFFEHLEQALDAYPGAVPVEVQGPEPEPEGLPPGTGDMLRTPDDVRHYIRTRVAEITMLDRKYANDPASAPTRWSPKDQFDGLERLARVWGVTWESLADERTEHEKMIDAIQTLAATPSEAMAVTDAVLERLEEVLATIAARGERVVIEELERRGIDPKSLAEVCRGWVARLRRIRTIRAQVGNQIPPTCSSPLEKLVAEITWTLRVQVYVGRSEVRVRRPPDAVYTIGDVHVRMAMDIWQARNRVGFHPAYGVLRPGDPMGEGEVFPGIPFTGAIIMLPPRHGKTEYLRFDIAHTICLDPTIQMAYLHARDEEATMFAKHVSRLFSDSTEAGRRLLSFWHVPLADYDNVAGKLRVASPNPPKGPNLIGSSVNASVQGINLDRLYTDDVVPVDDVFSQTERDRRKQVFAGKWITRLQSEDSQVIYSGYPWHHDDLLCDAERRAEEWRTTGGEKGTPLKICKHAVGGPKEGFAPIWPEMWPSKRLASKYQELNDGYVWGANYQLTPLTDAMRIVRQVAFYNADDPQHQRFLQGAVFHLSVDPAFTAGDKSDHAGLVLVASGEVEYLDGQTRKSSPRVRVIEAMERSANVHDLCQMISEIVAARRIDVVHIEANASGYGIRPLLESLYGIRSIIEHHTGQRKKEVRLRQCAPMYEAASHGLVPVVEFRGDNGLVHPEQKKLVEYVINFRTTSGHHSLDALNQVCAYLAPTVGINLAFALPSEGGSSEPTGRRTPEFEAKMRESLRPPRGERRELAFAEGGWV